MSKRQPSTSHLLINEEPLQVLPSLAVALGGLDQAIILQQMHYWLIRSHHERDGRTWFYNTYDQWKAQFPFWSISTIRRAIHGMEQKGVISSANYNNSASDKTKWYTVNYERINELCSGVTAQDEQSTAQDEQSTAQDEQSTAQDEQVDCSSWTVPFIDARAFPETTQEITDKEKESLTSFEIPKVPVGTKKKSMLSALPSDPAAQEQLRSRILDQGMLIWRDSRHPDADLDAQWDYFTNQCLSKDYRYADFRRAFMNSFAWDNSPAQQRLRLHGHHASPQANPLDTRLSVKGQRSLAASKRLMEEMNHGSLGLPAFLASPEHHG